MKDYFNKKLCEKYPKIFSEKTNLECSDGWYWLIDNLCEVIQHRVNTLISENQRAREYNSMLEEAKAGDFTKFNEYYVGFEGSYVKNQRENIQDEKPMEVKDIEQPVTMQVKSKFGGLRFYIQGGDQTIRTYISMAEHMSYGICETCGSTSGVAQSDDTDWTVTLCPEHYRLRCRLHGLRR